MTLSRRWRSTSEAADQAALQSATTEPGAPAAHNVVLCIDATEDIAWHIF
jgi:hypothetical protein